MWEKPQHPKTSFPTKLRARAGSSWRAAPHGPGTQDAITCRRTCRTRAGAEIRPDPTTNFPRGHSHRTILPKFLRQAKMALLAPSRGGGASLPDPRALRATEGGQASAGHYRPRALSTAASGQRLRGLPPPATPQQLSQPGIPGPRSHSDFHNLCLRPRAPAPRPPSPRPRAVSRASRPPGSAPPPRPVQVPGSGAPRPLRCPSARAPGQGPARPPARRGAPPRRGPRRPRAPTQRRQAGAGAGLQAGTGSGAAGSATPGPRPHPPGRPGRRGARAASGTWSMGSCMALLSGCSRVEPVVLVVAMAGPRAAPGDATTGMGMPRRARPSAARGRSAVPGGPGRGRGRRPGRPAPTARPRRPAPRLPAASSAPSPARALSRQTAPRPNGGAAPRHPQPIRGRKARAPAPRAEDPGGGPGRVPARGEAAGVCAHRVRPRRLRRAGRRPRPVPGSDGGATEERGGGPALGPSWGQSWGLGERGGRARKWPRREALCPRASRLKAPAGQRLRGPGAPWASGAPRTGVTWAAPQGPAPPAPPSPEQRRRLRVQARPGAALGASPRPGQGHLRDARRVRVSTSAPQAQGGQGTEAGMWQAGASWYPGCHLASLSPLAREIGS